MLNEFLPWLKSQLKQKNQLRKQPELPSESFDVNLSNDSLLASYDKAKLSRYISVYTGISIFTAIAFFLTWSINIYLDRQLSLLRQTQTDVLAEYTKNASTKTELDRLLSEISLYKNTLSEEKMSNYLKSAYIFSRFNMKLNSFSLSRSGFDIEVATSDVVAFAALLDAYIKDPKINYITIHSASLDRDARTYNVSMEVLFK